MKTHVCVKIKTQVEKKIPLNLKKIELKVPKSQMGFLIKNMNKNKKWMDRTVISFSSIKDGTMFEIFSEINLPLKNHL